MQNFFHIENLKSPVLAFVIGLMAGACGSWVAFNEYSDKKVELLTERIEVLNQDRSSLVKRNEELSEKLAVLQERVSSIDSYNRNYSELKNLAKSIDEKIAIKKEELAWHSGILVITEGEEQESPPSEAYLQIKREISDLHERKNEVISQMIEFQAK